jgi:hypothetical protein
MTRWLALSSVLVLAACAEEAAPTVTPLASSGAPQRAAVAEPPSPLIAAPHLRRVEHGTVPAAHASSSTGGGGSSARPPITEGQVDAFRDRLRDQVAEIDPSDDPCDQYREVMGATLHDDPPSRAAMRQHCRDLPDGYRQCLSPSYFREHTSECQQEIDQMADRGRRDTERAQRQIDAMDRGDRPWPGQRQTPTPRRPQDDTETEDG